MTETKGSREEKPVFDFIYLQFRLWIGRFLEMHDSI